MKKIIALILLLSLLLSACAPANQSTTKKEEGQQTSQGEGEKKDGKDEQKEQQGKEEPKEEKFKDTLIFAQGADVTSLDPHIGRETPAVTVHCQIFDTLVATDSEKNIVPHIAEKYEVIGDQAVKFFLRKGVKFHNGEELKAEDVKYSLERASVSPRVTYIFDFIDHVEIVDDYTVIVHTKMPYAPILNNLAHPCGAILNKKVMEADEESVKTNPIGCGPYKFVQWKQNEGVTLEAFEDYYMGAPKTKHVEMKVIPEAAQRLIALETGEIDIAYGIQQNDVEKVKNNDKLDIASRNTSFVTYLTLNTTVAPFDNLEFRQAMAHAIDKQLLVDTLLYGQGETTNSIITDVVFGGVKEQKGLEYDVDKAKALLEKSGVKLPVEITIDVNDNQTRIDTCQVLQSMFQEIGIEAKVNVMEFGAMIEKANKSDAGIQMAGWITSTSDADYTFYPLFHSTMAGAPGNRSFYSNATVDEKIMQARKTTNYDERKTLYAQIGDIIAQECPVIPLYSTKENVGLNKKVKSFEADPIGYHKLANVSVTE